MCAAPFREVERKRQEEWENHKRQELETQRQRQQETVLRLKAQNTQLVVQLNSAVGAALWRESGRVGERAVVLSVWRARTGVHV